MARNHLTGPKPHSLNKSNQLLKIPKKLIPTLNFILDPAVIVDLEGNLAATNDRLTEITGFERDELVGENLLRTGFVSSKSKICLMRKCFEASEKNDIDVFEIELNNKNGEKIWAEVKVKKIKCGEKVAELMVFHNITGRRNWEAALRESEERYRNLCEDARILMLNSDLKGNICYANKIAESYGFIQEVFIGKNILDFVSKKNHPKMVSTHLGAVSGKNVEEEIEIITPKGVFFVDYVSSPIRKEGRIIGCHIAMRDITDKKKMEKELENHAVHLEKTVKKKTESLRRSEKELKLYSKHLERLVEERTKKLREFEHLAAVGELAGMVGHDLRNPLTSIKGAVYYLKTKANSRLSENEKTMVITIERAIECSNKIINDLLEYSREIKLDTRETTPKELIQNLLSDLEIPSNIQLKDATGEEPKIIADSDKLNRIFLNLTKNAFDAMPNGGILVIRSERSNRDVVFSFTDTGSGMTHATLQKIWTPLFTTKSKGMGFGLAICKRLAEAHSGRVSVESTIGKGTTFKLAIPLNPNGTKFDFMVDALGVVGSQGIVPTINRGKVVPLRQHA